MEAWSSTGSRLGGWQMVGALKRIEMFRLHPGSDRKPTDGFKQGGDLICYEAPSGEQTGQGQKLMWEDQLDHFLLWTRDDGGLD